MFLRNRSQFLDINLVRVGCEGGLHLRADLSDRHPADQQWPRREKSPSREGHLPGRSPHRRSIPDRIPASASSEGVRFPIPERRARPQSRRSSQVNSVRKPNRARFHIRPREKHSGDNRIERAQNSRAFVSRVKQSPNKGYQEDGAPGPDTFQKDLQRVAAKHEFFVERRDEQDHHRRR